MASPHSTLHGDPSQGLCLQGSELAKCYQGPLKHGKRSGVGSYAYPNSFYRYKGAYVDGKKQGLGQLVMKDAVYEGEFYNDEIEGQGTKRFSNGNKYTGQFHLGELHGVGRLEMNGDVYEGQFKRNAFEGMGKLYCADGRTYEGAFSRGKRHGHGVETYSNGDRYEGEWRDGLKCGQGRCDYHNGDVYEGSWARDAPGGGYGKLTVQRRGGYTMEGEYLNGRPDAVAAKLNAFYYIKDDVKQGKKGAQVAAAETPTSLQVVPGQPLPVVITVAAQEEQLLPSGPSGSDATADDPSTRPATATPAPASAGAATSPSPAATPPPGGLAAAAVLAAVAAANAPPVGQRLVMHESSAAAGCTWRTAETESGRTVNVTLHRAPLQPLQPSDLAAADLCLSVCATHMPGEAEPRVRLLFLPALLGPPLGLARHEAGGVITSVQCALQRGAHTFEQLAVGYIDAEGFSAPEGGTYVLLFSGIGIRPGYLILVVTEGKKRAPVASTGAAAAPAGKQRP